ncbi:MAG: TIGR04084 family radical SAM/SPASM domain-containing protein [Euryarchaeota archaeon]|nr:TIGR04084 family radical SAM/SPASM domain-containing protein [Euryarchaeota archaeon]
MLYIVSTTGVCNLACDYCGGSFPASVMPREVGYPTEALRALVERDKDAVVAFYGGEPLLRVSLVREIMDRVQAKHFVLQTNGLFLDSIPDDCVRRLDTILVSLDGRPEVTNAHRGPGIHGHVMEKVAKIRPRFSGDLVARMTVSEESDIYLDVTHLLSQGFDHVHWQLNAIWSPEGSWTDFGGWIEKSYLPGITRLKKRWLEEMRGGRVLGIVPFQGVMERLRSGAKGLPCGAGRDAFAITTDGRILACPIGPEYEWNRLGTLDQVDPETLKDRLEMQGPCRSCPVANVCGGRCLFANMEGRAKRKEFDLVCRTVKHLIAEMEDARPKVDALMAAGRVTREEIAYPPFNNTTEIIP